MTISSLFSTFKVLAIALCLFAIYSVVPVEAQIPAGVELNGYAWSSNIGWISLNCKTGGLAGSDVCGTSNYSVKLNNANRNLSGYAWSSNIGWIKFNSLSGFPTGNGTNAISSRIASTDYKNSDLQGWIRACAGTDSVAPYECGRMTNNTVSGGWDGWISLKGTGYGVNTANFGSPQYVWGGDVVGWIDMSTSVSWYSQTSLSGTGCSITTEGGSTCNGKITWSFSSDVSNPTIVRTSPSFPVLRLTGQTRTNQDVELSLSAPNGDNIFVARSGNNGTNITTQTLRASCGDGLVRDDATGTCQLAPTGEVTVLNLTTSPSIVRRGGVATISWELSADPAGQCTLTGPNTNQVIAGQTGSITTSTLGATARFTLDCGASEKDVVITVVPAFNEI